MYRSATVKTISGGFLPLSTLEVSANRWLTMLKLKTLKNEDFLSVKSATASLAGDHKKNMYSEEPDTRIVLDSNVLTVFDW